MNSSRSIFPQGLHMRFGSVSFMLGQSILRELFVIGKHHMIPSDFGNNRRCRDRPDCTISPHHCFLSIGTIRYFLIAIDKDVHQSFLHDSRLVIHSSSQFRNCGFHGEKRRLENIDAIDRFRVDDTDSDIKMLVNEIKHLLTLFFRKFLGVPNECEFFLKFRRYGEVQPLIDDSGGYDWPAQRTPSGLTHGVKWRTVRPGSIGCPGS